MLKHLSLGGVSLLLLTNIWLILRQLNTTQCNESSYQPQSITKFRGETKKFKKFPNVPDEPYHIQKYETGQEENQAFNINLELGKWDKAKQFKMFDAIIVGDNFVNLSKQYSVCMATQSSIEKLHSIAQVSQHWAGPISAALFAAGDEEYFLLYWYIDFLRNCFPEVKSRVTFHLAVPRHKMPTGKYPEELRKLKNKSYECREYKSALDEATRLRNAQTVKWRTKVPYPQNHLRNLARKNCQSENVFLIDIDIVPSLNLAEHLDAFLKTLKKKESDKYAYVIPTYELDERTDFPKNKSELVRLSKKGLARAFHHKVFIYNQYATNFSRWETFSDLPDNKVVISHNVTNFEFLYEPFYVTTDTVPEHDERFLGYGYTRNSQVYETFVAGYQFQVLSPVFTIHWGLQGRSGRPPWRERQNSLNRQKFEIFKREVFARYKRDPLNMIN